MSTNDTNFLKNETLCISLVVPVYCEEDVLPEFYARTFRVLTALSPSYDYELVFINDGSTDHSAEILSSLAQKNDRVKVIHLSRNFGHQKAITAGLDHASGEIAVIMDADLQDPPEVIPEMLKKWTEGFKVVYGVRRQRRGESLFKRLTATAFYRLLNSVSELKFANDSGDFRLLDRAVIDSFKQIREDNRYIRGLISWIGFSQCPITYDRDPRYAGKTKFNLRKMLRFALDGVTSFSERPLELSSRMGFLVTFISFLSACKLIYAKLFLPSYLVQGWTSVMVAVLFLGGIQLIAIGVLGEYLGRIYRETKQRPLYIVQAKLGFKIHR